MEFTNFAGNKMGNCNEAPFDVHVLVVDGDAASLEVTLGLLASLNYKAEGTKHPLIALERLRKKEGYFDLIVIEPHLPDIDGFQFKQKLDQHFSIPLIMISMDNDERMMEKALKSGVLRYIVKPATASDFKGIWQYAVPSTLMKVKKPTISSSSPLMRRIIRDQEDENYCNVEDSWSTSKEYHNNNNNNNLRKEKKFEKRKEFVVRSMKNNAASEGGGDNNNGSSSLASRVTKKSKVVWTSDLQSRFLQAINIIGLENAVPKKILEVMKTPGLTRENVASHLQKYRLFLKRVARIFAMVMNNETDNKDVLTSLASKYPNSLMLKNIKEECRRMLQSRKLRNSSSSCPYYSSYKNPNNSSPLFKPSKFQFHHHNSANCSTQMMMNPCGLLHDQILTSTSSNYYTNNAGLGLGFPGVSSSPTYYDYCGYNNSFISGSNYSYLVDERVFPASNELFRANQSLPDMEGKKNNSNNNNLENILEQQGKQYEVSNDEGDHCYQNIGVEGNNGASLVTSHCSNLSTGFDCGNIIMQEDDNCKFSNQTHQQQDNQEVAGKDIDQRVESNDDYFPSFDLISDQVMEILNLSEKDLENLKELEQIPQDWADDFLESLLNNGV